MKTEELLDILNNMQCQKPGGKEKLYILLDHYPCDCAFYEIIKLVVENTNLTSVIAYLINNFHVCCE